jgi:hypothetical protein
LNWDTSKTLLAIDFSKHETFYREVLGSTMLGLFIRHEQRQIEGWIFVRNKRRKVAWSAPVTWRIVQVRLKVTKHSPGAFNEREMTLKSCANILRMIHWGACCLRQCQKPVPKRGLPFSDTQNLRLTLKNWINHNIAIQL